MPTLTVLAGGERGRSGRSRVAAAWHIDVDRLHAALQAVGLAPEAGEGGTEALSLRAAARRAGVSATAPYRHFADKDALLAAVAAYGFDLLAERLSAADAGGADSRASLIAQGVAYVRFACGEPALFRLMFGAGHPAGQPVLRHAGDRAFAVLARRVAAVASGSLRDDLLLAAWSLVHRLASLLVDGRLTDLRAADPEAIARRVTGLLLTSALTHESMRPN